MSKAETCQSESNAPAAQNLPMQVQRVNIDPGIVNFEFTGLSLSLALNDQPCKRMGIGRDRLSRQPLRAEQFYILPPEASGVCEYPDEHHGVVVEMSPRVMSEVGFQAAQDLKPLFDLSDPLLRQLVLASADLDAAAPALYRDSLSRALAAHAVQIVQPEALQPVAERIDDRRLLRAIEYIQSSLDDDLSLHDMAAAATLSPYHFSRMFKKATGHSPLQYVIRERMQRAEQLLRASRKPVTSIAWQVGYSDSVRFARHFKRHTSLTPTEFRAAIRH